MAELFTTIVNFIWFLVILLVILLMYRISIWTIKKGVKKRKFPLEAFNGIKLIIRLVTVAVIIVTFLTYIQLPTELVISISTFSGIFIGFGSTEVVAQIISGAYLISSRPFHVNQLVGIDGVEGIVTEIGTNYTKIRTFDGTVVQIPNKKILDSEVKKYTVKVSAEDLQEFLGSEIRRESEDLGGDVIRKTAKVRDLVKDVSKVLRTEELTRYTFEVLVEVNKDPEEVMQKFDDLCENYQSVYGIQPTYLVVYFQFRIHILFQIYSTNPFLIVENHQYFLMEIARILAHVKEVPQQ